MSEEARKIKGAKPEDVKKRKALQAEAEAAMNASVPYAEAVVSLYSGIEKPKSSEKINYKQSLVILKNVAEVKKDATKVASYDKLIKATEM